MSPFRILGLDRKADVAQIKRAYAKLLRIHRPDEDPEGFQRVHDAYETCLEQVRWREEEWYEDFDEDGDGAIEPTQTVAPETTQDSSLFAPFEAGTPNIATAEDAASPAIELPPADGFDADAFADELLTRLRGDTPEAVETWLQAHDDLYSLDRKHALQRSVVDVLETLEPSHASRQFETVTTFFGLDSISGTDGWLQQRLFGLQQRFGDEAEFAHVLRVHAGPRANWTDRQLVNELQGPRRWLRRLFLIAVPGLPGRVGALSRALHAADPESAATRLDQGARRFWERATNRNALHRERFAFIATRLLLWNALISGYTRAVAQADRGFLLDWVAGTFGFFVPWLAYALVVFGFLRFRDLNQRRMQWDMVTVIAGIGTVASAATTVFAPVAGMIGCTVTFLLWLGARGEAKAKTDVSAWATIATAAGAFIASALLVQRLLGNDAPLRHALAAAALYSMVVLILHDVCWARRQRITLERAHMATGWLWWLFGVHALAWAILLLVFPT